MSESFLSRIARRILAFTILTKLIVSFLIFTVMVIVAGVVSIYYTDKMATIFSDIYFKNLTAIQKVQKLKTEIDQSRLLTFKYLGSFEPEEMDDLRSEIRSSLNSGKRIIDEGGADYSVLNTDYRKSSAIYEKIFRLHHDFLTTEAQKIVAGESQLLYERISDAVASIEDMEKVRAEASLQDGFQIRDGIRVVMISIIVFRFFLNLAIALFIMKMITKPIFALVQFIKDIVETGDYSRRLENLHGDETGQAGRAVNNLMETLQNSFREINKVMHSFSLGDYSSRVTIKLKGDLAFLKQRINSSVSKMQMMISSINQSMTDIASGKIDTGSKFHLKGELGQLQENISFASLELQKTVQKLIESEKRVALGSVLLREMHLGVLVLEKELKLIRKVQHF